MSPRTSATAAAVHYRGPLVPVCPGRRDSRHPTGQYLVAMTRAIIAGPDLPNKALAGQTATIRPCIAINEGCIGRDYQGLPMLCSVNPAVAWPELDDYAQ